MSNGNKIIGIAGASCSGKTSLVAELQRRIVPPPMTWSFDEYDLYPAGSPAMAEELANPTITNWEDPALFEEETFVRDLLKVREGKQTTIETRARESLGRRKIRTLLPAAVNIVEGVFIYHDPRAVGAIGLRFFLDLPMEEMVRRRLARSEYGKDPWDEPAYITGEMVAGTEKYVLPQAKYAHRVLDAMQPVSDLADQVVRVMDHAIWER